VTFKLYIELNLVTKCIKLYDILVFHIPLHNRNLFPSSVFLCINLKNSTYNITIDNIIITLWLIDLN